MPTIGVELITKGEGSLESVLKSIVNQSIGDYTITCVNSSQDLSVSSLLTKYGVREIKVKASTRHLEARYLSHINCEGKFRLVLDSTRPLEPKAFETLIDKYTSYKATCIREGSIGEGFWANQADKLRRLSDLSFNQVSNKNVGYILPRFYEAGVLDSSFKFIVENINTELFKEISYGEHHLIYEAAKLTQNDIALTGEVLLKHYEDHSAISIFRKYKWYGKSQKTLNRVTFENNAQKLTSHKRPLTKENFLPGLETAPIRTLRIIAFMIGYLF